MEDWILEAMDALHDLPSGQELDFDVVGDPEPGEQCLFVRKDTPSRARLEE